MIPSVIGPYIVAAMGPAAARRTILTAERFSAREALRLGLVHEVVPAERLEETAQGILARLAAGGPEAQSAAKDLIFSVAGRPADSAVIEDTARRIASVRAGEEAREGLAAFLEKRRPRWRSN